MTTPKKGLQVHKISKSYAGRRVVSDLSFEVQPGEIVGLLGPNGAGKTTAFYITVGLIRPDSGQVIFNGCDVTGFAMHKRAQLGMGYLAQEPSVFRSLSVKDNILCILQTLPLKRSEQQERLEQLLCELQLTTLADKKAGMLSGGERRRLEITRALIKNPSFLLLDEPFANIDPIAIHDVQQIISHLSSRGIAVLITDHNAREIFSIAHRSYIIKDGSVMLQGQVEDLIHNEEARRTYLGNSFRL